MNVLQIAGIICCIASLPAVYIGVRRVINEKSLLSLILIIISGFLTATFISACFHPLDFLIYIINPENLEWRIHPWFVALPLILAGFLMDIIMYLVIKKTTEANLWKCIIILLGAFVGINLIIGIIGSLFTGYSFDQCFFGSCCASLGVSGFAWGLNYKEICVIGNIYMQIAIVFISSLYVVWMGYCRNKFKTNIWNFFLMLFLDLYGLMMFSACLIVINHYSLPLEEAYDLCYKELVLWAGHYEISYNQINYYIFIIGFLIITIGNILLGRLLRISPDKRDLHRIHFGEEPVLTFGDENI